MKKCAIPILLLLHLLYPLCLLTAAILGLEFSLHNGLIYLLFLTVLTVLLTWSGGGSVLAFPVTVIDGLCAVWGTYCLPAAACAVCWCVCGGILFHRAAPKGVKKVVTLIFSILLVIALALSCAIDLFAEGLRSVTVVREVDSPDGVYTAQVIDADYGATGGDTLVWVYDNDQTVHLLFGSFTPEAELGYRGEWGEFNELDVNWSDGHLLTIDGKSRIICSGSGLVRSIYLGEVTGITINGETWENPQWISDIFSALGKSQTTRMSTVQDYPNEKVLYEIGFGSSCLFLYQKNGTWYIEQPYQGIWEADESLLELLA